MKLNVLTVRISIVLMALLLCIAWGCGAWIYQTNQFKLRATSLISKEYDYAGTRGKTISADYLRSVKFMYGLPEVLASLEELSAGLQAAAASQERGERSTKESIPALQNLNQLLVLTKEKIAADVIWVMGVNGDTVASSNYQDKESFIGINFKNRDYFTTSMQGHTSYQYAVGKMTHQPGLYFGAPVTLKGRIIGVVVVKINLARLAHNIDISNTFLADQHGVIILSDDKKLEMKVMPDNTIDKLSSQQRLSIYQRDQFERIVIQPWTDTRYPLLRKIQDYADPYVINVTDVNDGQLKIYVVAPVKELLTLDQDFFRLFILTTLSGTAILIMVAGLMLYLHTNYITRKFIQIQHDELNDAQRIAQMGSWSYDYPTDQLHFSDEILSNFFMMDADKSMPTIGQVLSNIHPDDRERVKQVHKEGLRRSEGYQIEYRIIKPDGEVRNVVSNTVITKNEKGQSIKIAGTCKDVTEQLRTLRALEDSENHLRRIINSSLIGIIQGDKNGVILEMNQAFMDLTGYTEAHLASGQLAWRDLAPEEFKDLNSRQIFGQNKAPLPFEMPLTCSDGLVIQTLIGFALIEDLSSDWVCFVLDQSERHRINQLKTEFISVVSHELRTPLTSIRGSLALLEGGVGGTLSEKSLELVKIAHRNSRRLINIVNDILDMEKLTAGKMSFEMQLVDLVTIVKQAMESNEAFASNLEVYFMLNSHPEMAQARADASRLMQVLTNLMSNAAKFSPPKKPINLSIIKVDNRWRIQVQDYGIGIPLEFRSRIFGTFAQAEDANVRQKGGTGLGLHIAKQMVEKMEGEIGFESEEGQGTLFWVSFAAL